MKKNSELFSKNSSNLTNFNPKYFWKNSYYLQKFYIYKNI